MQVVDSLDHKSGDDVLIACECLGLIQGTNAASSTTAAAVNTANIPSSSQDSELYVVRRGLPGSDGLGHHVEEGVSQEGPSSSGRHGSSVSSDIDGDTGDYDGINANETGQGSDTGLDYMMISNHQDFVDEIEPERDAFNGSDRGSTGDIVSQVKVD